MDSNLVWLVSLRRRETSEMCVHEEKAHEDTAKKQVIDKPKKKGHRINQTC